MPLKVPESATGEYLSHPKTLAIPERQTSGAQISAEQWRSDDLGPIPIEIIETHRKRLAFVCFVVLAGSSLLGIAVPGLFQQGQNPLETSIAGVALALPWALLAWRSLKLGRLTLTPSGLSYPKIIGSRTIRWSEIEAIESGVVAGEGVAMDRLVIRMKNGKRRMPAGFSTIGEGSLPGGNIGILQRALSEYQ